MMFEDDPLVTVTTPDGRTITLPQSVAASFPDLQSPAPAQDPAAPPPSFGPQIGLQPASALPQPQPVAPPAPVPVQAPPSEPTPQPGPVTAPGPDQGTQQVAQAPPPPPPRPPTNAELARGGPASALAEQNRALDKTAAANARAAMVEADAATREQKILADRDAQTHAIRAELAKQAQQNLADREAMMQKRDQLADQIAKTRIDRSVDHPVWSAIGLVLSTLGTAMKTRPGDKWEDPAMNALMAQIDRKVDAQMKDLDIKRAALAQMNQGIAEQRQLGMDRLDEINARKDGALQQAQQMVQTMASQMKAPAALINADRLNAAIEEKRAELRGQAAERAQAQINFNSNQAQQARIHRDSQALQYRMHRETIQAQQENKASEIAARLLEEKNKISAERAKHTRELGIGDPRTGAGMLTKAGQAKVAKADQIEATARKTPGAAGMEYVRYLREQATGPDQQRQIDQIDAKVRTDPAFAAQAAREYAQVLRNEAQTIDVELAPTAEARAKLSEELASVQAVTNHIGDAIDSLEAGPRAFDRAAWASIKTELAHVAGRYMNAIGERPSVRAFDQTLQHIINFDADSIFQREASRNKVIASLSKLKSMLATNTDASLKANKISSGWTPMTRKESGLSFDATEKTARELADDATPGAYLARPEELNAAARLVAKAMGGDRSTEVFERESARPGSESGLSPNATTNIKAMAKRADMVGDAERARIADMLRAPIEAGLRDSGRESLAVGMLEVISTTNPGLRDEIVAAMPDLMRERVQQSSLAFGVGVGSIPGQPEPSGFDPDRQANATAQREARERAEAEAAAFARLPPTRARLDIGALLPPPWPRTQ